MTEPAAFDRSFWESENHISKIGKGAIGGKAQGLVDILGPIIAKFGASQNEEISVSIPKTTVVSTEFFDAFMKQNDLYAVAFSNASDERIAAAFQKASLPPRLVGDLRSLANEIQTPLAIRSSSLIEDSLNEPLAGVYKTKMTPNNQPNPDTRFHKIVEAVKYVWASTYFKEAKQYFGSLNRDIENEKMAVIIQEIVGRRHSDRFYPHISGVARSYNYYPWGNARPEYGIVDLALGMGKTIVDGGHVWSYCPACPRTPPPFCNTRDLLQNTQTQFWALNMGKTPVYDPLKEVEFMIQAVLEDAEYDNTLSNVASTFDAASDRILPGIARPGPRIIDFAPILKHGELSLNGTISDILAMCENHFKTAVEIEFAVTFPKEKEPAKFGLLQVRPLVVPARTVTLTEDNLKSENTIIASTRAIGNGKREDILDLVFMDPDVFEAKRTGIMALELEKINAALSKESRPYLLIGFGRFGTSDPFRGVPVTWGQISHARTIVEVALPSMPFEFSQGSHFFHNVTSFNVGYFFVPQNSAYTIDWHWIQKQKIVTQSAFITHVRLQEPLSILLDGKKNWGVIMKSEGAN